MAWWSYTHGIPYPPADSAMQALLLEVPDAANRFALEKYWLDRWDAHRIRMLIDAAAAWGHENNVPLISNEFAPIATPPIRFRARTGFTMCGRHSRPMGSGGRCGIIAADSAW